VLQLQLFPHGQDALPDVLRGAAVERAKLRQNMEAHNVKIPGVDLNEMFAYYDPVPRWRETPLMREMRQGPKELTCWGQLQDADFQLPAGWAGPVAVADGSGRQAGSAVQRRVLESANGGGQGAERRADGVVESQWGKTRGRLHVSELFHPEAVGIGGALGRQVSTLGKAPTERTHYNQLLGAPLNTIDPIAGGVEITVRVKVYAA